MARLPKDKIQVLLSSVGGKGLGMVASILVVRLLTTKDFAEWSYYKSFLTFLLPISGFGMDQVLLRYAYIPNTDKKELKNQTFSVAVISAVLVAVLAVIVVYFIRPADYVNSVLMVFVFFQLVTTQFNLFQQQHYRVENNFAKYSLVVLLASLFVSIAQIVGAFISVEVMALLVALCFLIYFFFSKIKLSFSFSAIKQMAKDRLKYGISIGIGGVLNKGIFVFDIIYIANMLNDQTALAGYKVISIIPFNLILLSNSILKVDFGDFVNFTRQDTIKYMKAYWTKGLLFLIPTGVVLYFFSPLIVSLLFGERYEEFAPLMFYYFVFIGLVILLRSPIGQLLNALGYAGYNTIITVVQMILLSVLFFLPFELSVLQMILYFCGIVVFLSAIQLVKLLRL